MTRKTTTVDLKELVMKELTDLFRRLHSTYPSETRSRLGLMQGELRDPRSLLCKSGTRVALRFWAFLMTAWQTVSRFDDLVHVRRADVTVQKDRVIIKFRKHKMKGRQGGTVFDTKVMYLPAPSAPPVELCAGSALQEYLKADPLVAGEDPASTPLFRKRGGEPLPYREQLRKLRSLLFATGRDGLKYGMHSPRIGGATCALMSQGGNEFLVKQMGFWKGGSVELYCRPTVEGIMEIQRQMSVGTATRATNK
jgi:integrase